VWVGWKGETPHKQQSGSVTELLSSAPALYGAGAGPVSGPVRSRRRAGIRPYTEQAPGRYPAVYGAGAGPVSGPIRSSRRAGIRAYTEHETNLMHRFGSSSSRSSGTGSRRPRCHSRGLPRDRGVSEGRLTVHNQR